MSDEETTRLSFIIVGASISGLASAIALKTAGHSVLVLERDSQLGGVGPVPNRSACAQIPPNGCKILLDWGLAKEIETHSAPLAGFALYKYAAEGQIPGPDHMGNNMWDLELLEEARGGYLQFSHRELTQFLYNVATKDTEFAPPVSFRFEAEVVEIDCNACSVTLRSGEAHAADAIIGADGVNGVVRRTLLQEEGECTDTEANTGMAVYSAIVENSVAVENGLNLFVDYPGSTIWAGSNRGLKTFPVGAHNDIWILFYTPDSSQEGNWMEEAQKKITDVLGPCDSMLQKLVALAGPATCIQMKEHHALESWVSASGRVLVLGDAAHPLPPGAVHSYSVALEDGAFIGKIFTHTRNSNRVPEFLRAFQEHRESRCSRIRQMEQEYISAITLPDGEMQVERDIGIRARQAAGQNVLEGDMQQMMEDFRMVFGYEATDDADEWWMTWGRYRDDSATSAVVDGSKYSTVFTTTSTQEEQDYPPPSDKYEQLAGKLEGHVQMYS
ncbi:FAD-binding-3 domain-containing protein [Favolaschia claudopus]|uniref:FAD-binding-3 domain-containing protein n=1 Tax=Favolaschia claudopus TaxID=2862362 RepID=A0AAW0CTF5_9AGAR